MIRAVRTIAAGLFFGACLLLSISMAPADEIVFGGVASFAAGVTGNWDAPNSIIPFARTILAPELSVFADTAELRAAGRIGRTFPGNGETIEGSVDTLGLKLYPSDWLTVELGLRSHIPGAAILLSPVNYLMPVTLDLGAGGELPSTAGSSVLLGATAFIGNGYVSAHVAPAPAVTTVPQSATAILEGSRLLSSVNDADLGGLLTRSSFAIGQTETLEDSWRRVSVGVEAGAALGPVDLTLIYYHGLDRIPTVIGTADTASLPAGEFDLSVAPGEAVIDAFGLSAQTAAGPAMFWVDGSFVLGRSFGTTDFVPAPTANLYVTQSVVAPHVEVVAGGMVGLERPRLLIAGEYRHGFIGSDREDIIRLDFPGTALLSLTADFANGLISTTAAGVVLIPDRSGVVVGSVSVSPSSELSAYLQAPLVIAGGESLLGSARTMLSVTAGVTYRF